MQDASVHSTETIALRRVESLVSTTTSANDDERSHHEDADDSSDARAKYSLGFILHRTPRGSTASRDAVSVKTPVGTSEARPRPRATRRSVRAGIRTTEQWSKGQEPMVSDRAETKAKAASRSRRPDPPTGKAAASGTTQAPSLTYEQKRLARKCTVDDCMNYTINNGRCFRHGGGKQCTFEHCHASAKIAGLCWKHGGSIQCVVDGCDRRGKSRGRCWHHGGGTKCQADACVKVAVSNGLCWAHGGGKRCQYDGCERPAYERTLNYCPKHFKRFESGEEILEL